MMKRNKGVWALCLALAAIFSMTLYASAEEKLTGVEQLKTERLAAQRGTVGQFIAEDLLGDKKAELLTSMRNTWTPSPRSGRARSAPW